MSLFVSLHRWSFLLGQRVKLVIASGYAVFQMGICNAANHGC